MEKTKIPGFPGYYATKDGKIFNGPRELSQHIQSKGYRQVHTDKGSTLVHRLVALAWLEKTGTVVHHKNGNKTDNRVENLEWTSQRRNAYLRKDAIPEKHCPVCQKLFKPKDRATNTCSVECGHRWSSGENSLGAKLTEDDVRNIRKYRALGRPAKQLSELYHITESTVCDIYKRRSWKHVY